VQALRACTHLRACVRTCALACVRARACACLRVCACAPAQACAAISECTAKGGRSCHPVPFHRLRHHNTGKGSQRLDRGPAAQVARHTRAGGAGEPIGAFKGQQEQAAACQPPQQSKQHQSRQHPSLLCCVSRVHAGAQDVSAYQGHAGGAGHPIQVSVGAQSEHELEELGILYPRVCWCQSCVSWLWVSKLWLVNTRG